jgi:predicted kinase
LVTNEYFVVVSGLPASGKSTLARELASALGLPLLDKDAILERLFESRGPGDATWRRLLSRESDQILQAEAIALDGAVLVSHWRLPGMPSSSGTPTAWLAELSSKVVHVHCECAPEIAAERFIQRRRHPGHRDEEKSHSEILAGIRSVALFGRLNIGPRVDVDTSQMPDFCVLLGEIHKAIETLRHQ